MDASVDYSDSALVCFDLSDTICLVTALDVVGVKHLSKALDTLLTIGLPRERFRVVLNRADSKVGLDSIDVERVMKITGRRDDPVEPAGPDGAEQGTPGGAGRAVVRGLDRRPAAGRDGSSGRVSARRGSSDGRHRSPTKKKLKLFSRGPQAKEATPCRWQIGSRRPSRRTGSPSVRLRVQERLVEVLGPRLYDSTLSDNELEGLVHQRLRELLDEEEGPLSAQEKLLIVRQIGDSVLGLGPLEPFVRDPEVSEIMVNGWDTIYVERAGQALLDRHEVPRRAAAAPHDRQDRRQGRPPRRRGVARTWTPVCPTAPV